MKRSAESLSPQEIERRYELLSRRIHLKLPKGTLTDLEEVEFRRVDRHYKEWLQQERDRNLAEYREQRYGRFGTFSELAERIDEFLYYYKFHVIFSVFLVLLILAGFQSYAYFQRLSQEAAAHPAPNLTVTLVGDFSDDKPEAAEILEQMKSRIPASLTFELRSISIPQEPKDDYEEALAQRGTLSLLSQHSDIYLVNSEHFSKLMQLGYVRKLEPWNNYGINVINGPLGQIIPYPLEQPLIAAVSISTKEKDKAVEFIQTFVTPEMEAGFLKASVIY